MRATGPRPSSRFCSCRTEPGSTQTAGWYLRTGRRGLALRRRSARRLRPVGTFAREECDRRVRRALPRNCAAGFGRRRAHCASRCWRARAFLKRKSNGSLRSRRKRAAPSATQRPIRVGSRRCARRARPPPTVVEEQPSPRAPDVVSAGEGRCLAWIHRLTRSVPSEAEA